MKLFLASPHTITRFPEGGDLLMRLFMAGGVSGNLKPFWKNTCQKMNEGEPFQTAAEESMKIFLAGGGQRQGASATNGGRFYNRKHLPK